MIGAPHHLIQHNDIKTWSQITPEIKKLGFDYAVYCFIKNNDKTKYSAITTDNAIQWGEYHLQNNYTKFDPVVASGIGDKTFIWNTLKITDKKIQKIMEERRDYGMKSGVTVPIKNKAGQPSGWLSLSCNNTNRYLDSIIKDHNFYENILDIHIKSIAESMHDALKINRKICYAIALSNYYTDINVISKKTGYLVYQLQKLFSEIYLLQPFLSMLDISSSKNDILQLESIVSTLNKFSPIEVKLSKRQLECVRAVAEGMTSTEGAARIGISRKTFESYLANVRRVLGCSNQKELLSILYSNWIL